MTLTLGNHQTWEYRVVYLRPVDEGEALTYWGAAGWELVAVLDETMPYSAKAYLKRPCVALPAEEQIDARREARAAAQQKEERAP